MTPSLSVVLPLYATRGAVPELVDRLVDALTPLGQVELVFVDDACPQRSFEAVVAHAPPAARVVVCRHAHNAGQHAAVMTGVRAATGELVAVMDADLQDAPEDLVRLVAHLRAAGRCDAVAAGRRGRYEGTVRRSTARAYRLAVRLLSGGRIPADAGLFLVMTAPARRWVLDLDDPRVHLVAALGRVGARVATVPIERRARPVGSSSYGSPARLGVAVRALVVLTPLYPLARRLDRRWRSPVVATIATIAATVDRPPAVTGVAAANAGVAAGRP